MFVIKIKGKAKIPDYIQLRDDNFTLLAYFRTDRPEKELEKHGFGNKIDQFKSWIDTLSFGKLYRVDL